MIVNSKNNLIENKCDFADVLTLTNKCSAGCEHCPFGNKIFEYKHLSSQEVLYSIKNSSSSLIVLTGGEPLEHPDINKIFISLKHIRKNIRLATGGHINFLKFIPILKSMRSLTGVSLGTDILSNRVKDKKLLETWKNNCNILNRSGLKYSLTITLGTNLDHYKVLKQAKDFGANPEFIYLRREFYTTESQSDLAATQSSIESIFGPLNIITGN